MRLLVTGAGGGLGRFLFERLGGLGLTRQNAASLLPRLRRSGVGTILHCAASPARQARAKPLREFLDDNLFLTRRLLELPHRKFVYISTVDVYPKSGSRHAESDPIRPDKVEGLYAMTKWLSERLVQDRGRGPLILRPSSLLGEHARPNSLSRLLDGGLVRLSASGDSRFNCVRHEDLLEFLRIALRRDLRGIYNLASSSDITLLRTARSLGAKAIFGRHRYRVPRVDNRKAAALWPAFQLGSLETLRRSKKV